MFTPHFIFVQVLVIVYLVHHNGPELDLILLQSLCVHGINLESLNNVTLR